MASIKLIVEDIKSSIASLSAADYLGCDIQDIFDKLKNLKKGLNFFIKIMKRFICRYAEHQIKPQALGQ